MEIKSGYGIQSCPDAVIIRQKVFVEEQGFQEEFDQIDEVASHVVLYHEGVPSATGRVFPKEGNIYQIGRIAVLKECRGQDYGRQIVDALEQIAHHLGAAQIELSSQKTAQGFYERLGYTAIETPYYDEHCLHQKMFKKI